MNNQQAILLNLIKEIDRICKKHNIVYYCAGGTVIGAARHQGFIPWDDDIDIYMTREEFNKFIDAFNEENPKNRALECKENNSEYYSVINRYVECGSTFFCRYHMLGHSVAGNLIDIFILDPVTASREAKREHISKLFIYAEYLMPFYSFSHRCNPEHVHLVEEYDSFKNEYGLNAVLKKLESEIFTCSEDDGESYILRWGSSPSIFPQKMLGQPVYMKFEDTELPMPEKWYDYLVLLYGADWMEIPFIDNRIEHNNILRDDISYEYFYKKRDEFYTEEYLIECFNTCKVKMRERYRRRRELEKPASEIHVNIVSKIIELNKARLGDKSIKTLFLTGNYESIIKVFEQYIKLQTSKEFCGALQHTHIFRLFNPIVVPIDNEDLYVLLLSLLRCGKIRLVGKIVDIYQRADIKSDAISIAESCLDAHSKTAELYITGKFDECISYAEKLSLPEEVGKDMIFEYYTLSRVALNKIDRNEITEIYNANKNSIAIKKAYADFIYNSGDIPEAKKIYNEITKVCRNGIFLKEINERVPIPKISYTEATRFAPNEATELQMEMLKEISEFCNENEIHYMLSPDLSRRIIKGKNIGYENKEKIIFMDLFNAKNFIDKFRLNPVKNRKLVHWGNSDTISSFFIYYSDTNSIYSKFSDFGRNAETGISITIKILRPQLKFANPKVFLYEVMLRKKYLSQYYMNEKSQGIRKLIDPVLHSQVKNDSDGKLENKLFNEILRKEINLKKDCYYYKNDYRNKLQKPKMILENELLNTTEIEFNGTKYSVPESVASENFNSNDELDNSYEYPDIFTILYSGVSWDDVRESFDFTKYISYEWTEFRRAELTSMKYNKIRANNWRRIVMESDKLDLINKYRPNIDIMKSLLASSDYKKLGDLLVEMDKTVDKYLKSSLLLQTFPELDNIYLKYLTATGRFSTVKTIKKIKRNLIIRHILS